jgi:hypothetical protein
VPQADVAVSLADTQSTIEIDTVAFEAGMQRIREGVRQGLINPEYGTLTVQARLLSERCQDLTPPRSKEQGLNAVQRDITRLFYPLKASQFKNKRIAKIVREDDRAAWDAVAGRFSSGNELKNTTAISFSPQMHEQWRNRRGRIGSPKKKNLGFVTLGQEARKVADYIKKKKGNVGWAKAGWSMGVISFGGRVREDWVRRHSVMRGQIVDGRREPDPWVRVINDTGWARSGIGQQEGTRIVNNAVSARARDMQRYAENAMEKAAAGKPIYSAALPVGM